MHMYVNVNSQCFLANRLGGWLKERAPIFNYQNIFSLHSFHSPNFQFTIKCPFLHVSSHSTNLYQFSYLACSCNRVFYH